jgi:hypothetical protein
MLGELLANAVGLFFRGDRDRLPIRSLPSGRADLPQRKQEPDELGAPWFGGPAAAGEPVERQSNETEYLGR